MVNHTTLRCWHRFNQTFQSEDIPHALAALSISNDQDNEWFPNMGASAHMTADHGKLQSLIPYYGSEKIMVRNGESIDITHIGSKSINVGSNQLKLDNVLVVLDIKKSLILIVNCLLNNFTYLSLIQ